MKPIEENLTRSQIRIWREFKMWLTHKQIVTNFDFEIEQWRWMVSTNQQYLKIDDETNQFTHKKSSENNQCKLVNDATPNGYEMKGIVGRLSKRYYLTICGEFNMHEQIESRNEEITNLS